MELATDYTEKAVIKSCWSGDTTTGNLGVKNFCVNQRNLREKLLFKKHNNRHCIFCDNLLKLRKKIVDQKTQQRATWG